MSREEGSSQPESPPRAEAIIADIYGSVSALREEGREPYAIVMPIALYRTVQEYRAGLGEIRDGLPDYLGRYELFGIPIYTDTGDAIVIRTRTPDGDARR